MKRDISPGAFERRKQENLIEVATTLYTPLGYIRGARGEKIVFVEPENVPCTDEECGREHHWLQSSVLRRCPGQPAALVPA